MDTFKKLHIELEKIGVDEVSEKIEKLKAFKALCLKWNSKYNLFSKKDTPRFDERHLLDSLTPVLKLSETTKVSKWLDMGCGTGFPILPLSIVLDKCKFHGVEPRSKRVLILNTFRRELGLDNIEFTCSKIEEFSEKEFDVVSCRALGSLEEDWNRAEKHLKTKGSIITFKTKTEIPSELDYQSIPYHWDLESEPYQLIRIRNV